MDFLLSVSELFNNAVLIDFNINFNYKRHNVYFMKANFDNVYYVYLGILCLTLKPTSVFLEIITRLMIFDAFTSGD